MKKWMFWFLTINLFCMYWNIFVLNKKIKELEKLERLESLEERKIGLEETDLVLCQTIAQKYGVKILNMWKIMENVNKYSFLLSVDKDLILKIIAIESGFNNMAVSSKGAKGLMQIMPETAEMLAKSVNFGKYDLFSIEDNIFLGVLYLRYLFDQCKNEEEVLRRYFAGSLWQEEFSYKYYQKVKSVEF